MFISNKQDIAERLRGNPIITPDDIPPSCDAFEVIGAFNPGVFEYKGKIGLLLRVAERPHQRKGYISTVQIDPATGKLKYRHFKENDPDLDASDPRIVVHRGMLYLTSISHFRLAWSDDGVNFAVEPRPTILPEGIYETFGIEDARVSRIGRKYYITYSAVSEHEVAAGMITTTDWRRFERVGPVLQPFNKDVCIFGERRSGYWLIHRPSGILWDRHWMWISKSPDAVHWGRPVCLARTRPGKFDSVRLGAGAPPILTPKGYLEIYHGADKRHRYCLGGMLLDKHNPATIIARSDQPIMKPIAPYERAGFFGNVVFTDGAILRDDQLWLYYAAADTVTCLARISLPRIF